MKDVPKIYFDEAGNTGDNLLDSSQPVYCLLSTCYTDEETESLLSIVKSNAQELHFKNLKKYRGSQLQILEILNHENISFEKVKYAISNKEYAVVGHIIDRLVEPVLYDMNHDGYASGLNSYFANFLFLLGKYEWGQERFSKMTSSFQTMIRSKSNTAIDEFYKSIFIEYNQSKGNEKYLLDFLVRSLPQINPILNQMGKFDLDLSLTSFGILVDYWGKQLNQQFNIIHDDSKQIDFWKEYISFLSSSIITPKEVGFGDKTMRFPFQIKDLQLVNSKSIRQVQLADILVSSIVYSVSAISIRKENDQFAKEIFESKLLNIYAHSIWPSTNHVEPTLQGIQGENMLDYLAEIAKQNPEEYKRVRNSIGKS